MKGLSADRLFFYSALVSAVSFLISTALWYLWPIPFDASYVPSPTDPSQLLSSASWILAWAGVVTLVLGLVARKS